MATKKKTKPKKNARATSAKKRPAIGKAPRLAGSARRPKAATPKKAAVKRAKAATPKKAAVKRAKAAAPKKAAVKRAKAATPKKAAVKGKLAQRPARAQSSGTKASSRARPSKRIVRRDASGHLDPKYAADLLRKSGSRRKEAAGFVDRPRSGDDLAEILGEQFVETATTGESEAEEVLDQVVPEERGGPFVQSTAGAEFAEGTDGSNPKGAKREPFPTT
jgi:hypothetical protein